MPIANADDDARMFMVTILVFVAGAFFLIWCISFAIRSANHKEQREREAHAATPPPFAARAEDPPGTFVVTGVDKESGLDVTEYIPAVSSANAKVKAELKGVVVTGVRRA